MIKKNVTMSDIAKAMNISTVSVSKALGGREGVSDELREKIKRKAAEMGYSLNSSAHSAKDGFTHNIGIIAPKRFISEPSAFYWSIYKHIVELLQEKNYYGMLEVINDSPDAARDIPNSLSDKKVDGLILLGQFSDSYIDKLLQYYVPMVFLDYYGSRENAEIVLSDSFYGTYQLTSYVISNGHRKIGFLGNTDGSPCVQDRFLGFYKALLEKNLPLRQEWIIRDRNSSGELFKTFALPDELPTAFVCACDESAFNLITQLKADGCLVPHDVSVTGYDNHIYSSMTTPHLTTIDVNCAGMAGEAVDIILKKIHDKNFFRGRTLVTGRLVIRDSVRNLYD
ncbi:MAG: substrate-binding domain-containing protein [Oscillospiraceae bacterium]|nr:substrate-binding domain-containing protein [Oscillospiraceae bacterium]